MTKEIIRGFCEKIRADPLKRKAVEEECERILTGIKGVKEERIIVTTHAYLAQLEKDFLKDYTVIIDEDFLQLFVFNRMSDSSCLFFVRSISAVVYLYNGK